MTYQSVNPFNGKLLKSFDEITDAQFEAKIAAADVFRDAGGRSPMPTRD